ncbi:queuosine precursor transporter [Fulvimarina sp. 2208YS6-2-32]|uniref:Probable queuosine precursor transporter n=1 Tax=Fulvimarina uroteuthidis TaxID=3098149 RepID=A0ABU5I782_9HYPH|nr:queuosine precursor transporter [Fulvimarina sp. 2208YS6-2-32]MDY8111025.1 queuosine precursor transporter [Fulvimarina sp. 2208YS6-2-32]
MTFIKTHWLAILAMSLIVLGANIAVQYPIFLTLGSLDLADILTYGAFVYPFAFLVTDLTNRIYGPATARKVVFVGFAAAVICSLALPPILFDLGLVPYEAGAARISRIALASGSAFLIAQLLDIFVFNRLRQDRWWRAPAASSISGSLVDTAVFFGIAFAPVFLFLGPNDDFALEAAPFFGLAAADAPRWVSWALGDLALKLSIAVFALVPYRIIIGRVLPAQNASVRAGA